MIIDARHRSITDYRYGFNGMEKDDELKGEGNSYDFGARMYDPRIGRWFSIDNLHKKYPDLSPYSFTNNNPVVFVDYDGNDFGILIDHVNKSILIVADIYTTSASTYKQAMKAAKQWNGKSASIEGYTVKFSVMVMKDTNPTLKGNELIDKRIRFGAAAFASSKDNFISNIFAGLDGPDSRTVDGSEKSFVGGITSNGKVISMNREVSLGDLGNYTDLVSHEFGHLFGLDDEDGDKDNKVDPYYGGDKGIMKYTGLNLNPISDDDVKTILKFAKINMEGKLAKPEMSAKVKLILQQGESNGDNPLGVKNKSEQFLPLKEISD